MLFHSVRRNPPPLTVELQNTPIELVTSFKFLGVNINQHLSWDNHIASITNKVSRNINLLRRMSWLLPRPAMLLFYNSYILPLFDYCDVVWNCCTDVQASKLERIQNCAGYIILKKRKSISAPWIREQLGWPTLKERRKVHLAKTVFKCLNHLDPGYLAPLLTPSSVVHHHDTRASASGNHHLPRPSTNFGKKALLFKELSYGTPYLKN